MVDDNFAGVFAGIEIRVDDTLPPTIIEYRREDGQRFQFDVRDAIDEMLPHRRTGDHRKLSTRVPVTAKTFCARCGHTNALHLAEEHGTRPCMESHPRKFVPEWRCPCNDFAVAVQ